MNYIGQNKLLIGSSEVHPFSPRLLLCTMLKIETDDG